MVTSTAPGGVVYFYYCRFLSVFFINFTKRKFRPMGLLIFVALFQAGPLYLFYAMAPTSPTWSVLSGLYHLAICFIFGYAILMLVGVITRPIYDTQKQFIYRGYVTGKSWDISVFTKDRNKFFVLMSMMMLLLAFYASAAETIVKFSALPPQAVSCFDAGPMSIYLQTLATLPPRLELCQALSGKIAVLLKYGINTVVIGALLSEIGAIAYRKAMIR